MICEFNGATQGLLAIPNTAVTVTSRRVIHECDSAHNPKLASKRGKCANFGRCQTMPLSRASCLVPRVCCLVPVHEALSLSLVTRDHSSVGVQQASVYAFGKIASFTE